jgi:hypothetical protein
MPLPSDFNPLDHIKSVLSHVHNFLVNLEFSDVGGIDWEPSIDTPRDSLRTACTIAEDDTDGLMLLRLWVFYVLVRKARDFHPYQDATPTTNFQLSVEFLPQVKLLFYESRYDSLLRKKPPIEAQISYRLMTSPSDLTEDDVKAIALKIKETFVSSGTPWSFDKGKYKVSYRDKKKGYQFILSVASEAIGKEIITKVLSLNTELPDWKYLTVSESRKPVSTTPETITIIEKDYDLPVWRPTAKVHFTKAELAVWGMPQDRLLVCRGDLVDRPVDEYF